MEKTKSIKIRRLMNRDDNSFITTSIVLAEDLGVNHHFVITYIKNKLLKEVSTFIKLLLDQHIYFFNEKELSFILKNIVSEDVRIDYDYINIENSKTIGLLPLVIYNISNRLDNTIDDVLSFQNSCKKEKEKKEEDEDEFFHELFPGIRDMLNNANKMFNETKKNIKQSW